MNTHAESFVDALIGRFGSIRGLFRAPPANYVTWLRQKEVPAWLRRHLTRYALAKDQKVGVVRLYAPSSIKRHNDRYPIMVRQGFLQVGSALNGDPVVVQFSRRSGKTGYLSHEELWSDESESPEQYFLPVSDSFGAFVAFAVQIDRCPMDYYGNVAEQANNDA